ncbi:uncharacterized protein LOC134537786 [Bacillus rossius redtenbacheri]|uniref:uncharacterized protein LOC134537786 n=1 Tax=Bacillus rossius redtenbacheri TaxID=93214 RepID=UPI002FDD57BD
MDTNEEAPTVEDLKAKGNECVKNGKFVESILHYSHAIKLDQSNYVLYSNRSLSFFKMEQYYLALEDAKETVRLKPDWAKGYFRMAEVQYAAGHYEEALQSYTSALRLQSDDTVIRNAILRTTQEMKHNHRVDEKVSWLGAGVGIIVSVALVFADRMLTSAPTITHPIVTALLIICVAMLGYAAARAYRFYMKTLRRSLLDPPVDLLPGEKTSSKEELNETDKEEKHHRYTKAQARQRFKKGKS